MCTVEWAGYEGIGMRYIRTREDALDAAAEILDLPTRADQLIQSTVRIMLCLDVEPREFLTDCQALLIEGGLDALRARRRDALEAVEDLPLVVLDPEEDRLLDSLGSALDALRFAEVLRQVFPDVRHERWMLARAVLLREGTVRDLVSAVLRARGEAAVAGRARAELEKIIAAARPGWMDRAGALLSACRRALAGTGGADPDALPGETTLLFELTAVDDARAAEVLAALDSSADTAAARLLRLRELAETVQSLRLQTPEAGADGSREVA